MKTDFQNIINIGNFLEKYTKTIKSCNGDIPDLNAWCDPLVLARNVITICSSFSSGDTCSTKKNGDDER